LIKDYGTVRAVNGLELEVHKGECFGLLGPNGAGKTTTVEILEGLLAPTSGEVELLGRTWASDSEWLRQRLGISLQETNLPDKLTVEETLLEQTGRTLTRLATHRATLEDVFVSLTGRQLRD
jgi:ABC-2 type transport system ATP-binding protein